MKTAGPRNIFMERSDSREGNVLEGNSVEIRCYPDPVLSGGASVVDSFDAPVAQLAGEMLETMHANDGVGLAAVQVGVQKRIITVCAPESSYQDAVLVNPEIVEQRGEQVAEEGCLSCPGVLTRVARAEFIVVRGWTIDGEEVTSEASGLAARVIQHEIDHLDGVTIVNRLTPAGKIAHKQVLKDLDARFRLSHPEE